MTTVSISSNQSSTVEYSDSMRKEMIEVRPKRRLHIITFEPKEQEPLFTVFFFHGGGGRADQFIHQAKYLFENSQCKCVLVDWLGHGESDKPEIYEAYHYHEIILDCESVFSRFHSKKQNNILIGHSLGSGMVLHLLYRNLKSWRSKVCRVLLLNSSDVAVTSLGFLIGWTPLWLLSSIRPLLTANFAQKAYHKETDPRIIEIEQSMSQNNPLHVFRALISQYEWPSKENIKEIGSMYADVPFLIVTGEGDQLTPPENAKSLHQILSTCGIKQCHYLEMQNVAHNIMIEKPNELSVVISQFIANPKTHHFATKYNL